MNYFTPDLLERFASEDDRIALAAQEELEQRSERYLQHLQAITPKLPQRFREMQERFCLHDARVVGLPFNGFPLDSTLGCPPEMIWGVPFSDRLLTDFPGRWQSLLLALQLDPPPKEFLVLHYRLGQVVALNRRISLAGDRCPFLEWQYDEVDLVPADGCLEFAHSILFTDGLELQLRFLDFDYATLKPLTLPTEPEEPVRAKPAS
jgi:hypothetical protein